MKTTKLGLVGLVIAFGLLTGCAAADADDENVQSAQQAFGGAARISARIDRLPRHSEAAADVDGDGRAEIIVAANTAPDADGADVDGDGRAEIIVAATTQQGARVGE